MLGFFLILIFTPTPRKGWCNISSALPTKGARALDFTYHLHLEKVQQYSRKSHSLQQQIIIYTA